MNLLAADIVERFYTFLWPMLRISALMIAAPIFSLSAFNLRLRITKAIRIRSRRLNALKEKMGAAIMSAEMRSIGHKKV